MLDPAIEIQKSVYSALIAANVCNGSIFHDVPADQALPYCTIGEDEIEGDDEYGPHSIATVNVSVFGSTLPRVKLEWLKVRAALDTDLAVTGFRLAEQHFDQAIFRKEKPNLAAAAHGSFAFHVIPTS